MSNISSFNTLLKANNQNRIRSRDMFMLTALWMELYPSTEYKTVHPVRPTGCVLVDQRDRIVSLQCTGESHAIVRAILKSSVDPYGCDIFVSRFPCSLCTKMMVQAGIRKIYYFPAKGLEIDWVKYCENREKDGTGSPNREVKGLSEKIKEAEETNINSVSRLIANNPIAMSKYIPTWTSMTSLVEELQSHTQTHSASSPFGSSTLNPSPSGNLNHSGDTTVPQIYEPLFTNEYWQIDDATTFSSSTAPFTKYSAYQPLAHKFEVCIQAINILQQKYLHEPKCLLPLRSEQESGVEKGTPNDLQKELNPDQIRVWQHAIILAHIASKRTDDPKIGVGAVLVYADGTYGSVGWNGYPKKADILDYPQAGADDFIEHELKYDYILHAEQNALLWRMNPAKSLQGSTVVSTKMPCDECSPVLHDCGVVRVVTNVQLAKSLDDPARLRGLTYEKIQKLMKEIWVF